MIMFMMKIANINLFIKNWYTDYDLQQKVWLNTKQFITI